MDVRIAVGANLSLAAKRTRGKRGAAVVAPPHPEYGGNLHNPVVRALIAGCAQADVGTLAFDWRGVGGSEGTVGGDAATAAADVGCAVDALYAEGEAPITAAGYSFGAAAALSAGAPDSRVERLVLVAPPLPMIGEATIATIDKPVTLIVGDDDMFSPLHELRQRAAAWPQVQLHVLDGIDHFFAWGGTADVTAIAATALAE